MNKTRRYYEDPVFNSLVNKLITLSEPPHNYGMCSMIDAFLMSQFLDKNKQMRIIVYPQKALES